VHSQLSTCRLTVFDRQWEDTSLSVKKNKTNNVTDTYQLSAVPQTSCNFLKQGTRPFKLVITTLLSEHLLAFNKIKKIFFKLCIPVKQLLVISLKHSTKSREKQLAFAPCKSKVLILGL